MWTDILRLKTFLEKYNNILAIKIPKHQISFYSLTVLAKHKYK